MKAIFRGAGARLATGLLFVILSTPATASDWMVEAKIAVVEATYIPASISFQINSPAGSCPSGAFLTYNAQGATDSAKQANVTSVLALLMTAQSRNALVRLYGVNSGCIVQNIWMFS